MNKLLFMVEFGEPSLDSYSRSEIKPVFVVATSYSDAEKKAEKYLHDYVEKILDKKESILTLDGSLRVPLNQNEIGIRFVRQVADKIIE